MYLVVSATPMELAPLRACLPDSDEFTFLLSGVGPVEAAMNLTEHLALAGVGHIAGVVNVGLAGAYPETGISPLAICLADTEVFGDIGVCLAERIEELDSSFSPPLEFTLDHDLLNSAARHLSEAGIPSRRGNFVTVASACGTMSRSIYLRDKFQAICENMEGAAVARVCRKFALPCLELRCVSNLVIERGDQHWRTKEAVADCCRAAQAVLEGLSGG